MSLKNANPIDPRRPKKVALVLSKPAVSSTTGWPVGANIMANPVIAGKPTVMCVCGDEEPARKTVLGLAADVGFEPVDFGPLSQARLLEPWAMLWIWLAFRGDAGREFGFARLRR